MSREEFLRALREGLSPLSQEERDAAVRYYEEFLDEAQDEGVAIEELGDVRHIVERILQDSGVVAPKQAPQARVAAPAKPAPVYRSVWFWLCVVFTLPVTLPLALGLAACALGLGLAALALVIGLGAGAQGLVVGLFAAVLAVFLAGVVFCVYSFYLLPASGGVFLCLFGGGLALTGAGLLTGLGLICLLRALFRAGRRRRRPAGPKPAPNGSKAS